ncbi:MAG: NADH pyrophosphatase, partial [Rhodospirillaceae bacterium]
TQEEAGVRIDPDSLDYVASQPWPWPGNIMCAFIGRALADELDPDLDELEDVAWFTREQVAAMGELGDPDRPETEPKLPRRDAVARHLILRWLHG